MKNINRINLFTGFSTVGSFIGNETIHDIELVKRDLLNHFMTRKGERVMLSDFGSIAWDLLFEPFDNNVVNLVEEDTKNIINQEPRVELQDIQVTSFEHGLKLEVFLFFKPFEVLDSLSVIFDKTLQER